LTKNSQRKVIFIRAAEDIDNALEELAEQEQRSKSNMAEVILRRYLEDIGKLPKESHQPKINELVA
jgi:hypothetical protein